MPSAQLVISLSVFSLSSAVPLLPIYFLSHYTRQLLIADFAPGEQLTMSTSGCHSWFQILAVMFCRHLGIHYAP